MGRQERARRRAARRQLAVWTRRRVIAWTLFVIAILVAIQHVVAHAGWQPLPITMGWQDLFLGYPMAGLVAIAGAMTLDRDPPK